MYRKETIRHHRVWFCICFLYIDIIFIFCVIFFHLIGNTESIRPLSINDMSSSFFHRLYYVKFHCYIEHLYSYIYIMKWWFKRALSQFYEDVSSVQSSFSHFTYYTHCVHFLPRCPRPVSSLCPTALDWGITTGNRKCRQHTGLLDGKTGLVRKHWDPKRKNGRNIQHKIWRRWLSNRTLPTRSQSEKRNPTSSLRHLFGISICHVTSVFVTVNIEDFTAKHAQLACQLACSNHRGSILNTRKCFFI